MLPTRLMRLALCLFILLTVTHSQTGPEWTQKSLTPDTAQAFLETTLHGEKNVTITGVIANTDFKNVSLGTSCRSNSTGTVDGKVIPHLLKEGYKLLPGSQELSVIEFSLWHRHSRLPQRFTQPFDLII